MASLAKCTNSVSQTVSHVCMNVYCLPVCQPVSIRTHSSTDLAIWRPQKERKRKHISFFWLSYYTYTMHGWFVGWLADWLRRLKTIIEKKGKERKQFSSSFPFWKRDFSLSYPRLWISLEWSFPSPHSSWSVQGVQALSFKIQLTRFWSD